MPVEPGLTHRADEILAAFSGTREFEKGATDLPRIEGDAHKVGLDLERLRARIGVPDLAALEVRQPPDAARARIERLIRERADPGGRGGPARPRPERRTRRAGAAGQGRRGRRRDPGPDTPARGPEAPRPPARADRRTRDPRRDDPSGDGAAAQPGRAAVALRGRPCRPCPDAPARPRHGGALRQRLDTKTREHERAADRRDTALRQVAATRTRLREREAGRPVATRERLEALRATRDAAFAPLRDALAVGRVPAIAEIAAYERAHARVGSHRRRTGRRRRPGRRPRGRPRAPGRRGGRGPRGRRHPRRDRRRDRRGRGRVAGGLAAGRARARFAGRDGGMARRGREPDRGRAAARRAADRADRLRTRIEAARAPLSDLRARAGLDAAPDLEIAAALEGLEARLATLASRWEATFRPAARCAPPRPLPSGWRPRSSRPRPAAPRGRPNGRRRCCPSASTARRDPRRPKAPWKHGARCRTAWRSAPRCCAGRPASAGTWRRSGRPLPPWSEALAPDLADAPPPGGDPHPPRPARRRTGPRGPAGRAGPPPGRGRDGPGRAADLRDAARTALTRQVAAALPDLAEAAMPELEILFGRLSAREPLRAELLRLRGSLAGASTGCRRPSCAPGSRRCRPRRSRPSWPGSPWRPRSWRSAARSSSPTGTGPSGAGRSSRAAPAPSWHSPSARPRRPISRRRPGPGRCCASPV